MDQPCKEGQPEQAAANEDREKQVVAFIDNPEDVLVDTEEEEEDVDEKKNCQGTTKRLKVMQGHAGAAAGNTV